MYAWSDIAIAGPRHLAQVHVSFEFAASIYRSDPPGQWRDSFRVVDGIPPDAVLVAVFISMDRQQVIFRFEHESFPLVHPGDALMPLRPIVHTRRWPEVPEPEA